MSLKKLNKYSARITEPKSQGASQAMLIGTGLSLDDLKKAQVGIASMWYEGNTCNMHLNGLASLVKDGVTETGLVGMRFNTIGVSDGISMGTDGMSFSLQSREIIADSIETVVSAQWYDALVTIPGCDKNMPGCMIAMGRLNRPSIMVYGGTIRAGCIGMEKLDIISAFQSYGEYLAGSIDEETRINKIKNSCPGAGACGGMYTANTMAVAIEAMGMSLPHSSSTPADSAQKRQESRRAGQYIRLLLEKNICPKDIVTEKSLHNALVSIIALGGSTNAVLHMIAIAHAFGLALTIDDVQKVSDAIPLLADFKPSGKYVMEDLHKIGGTPAVLKYLLEKNLIHGDCLTVTGNTMAENLATCESLPEDQKIIFPIESPIKKSGHLQILKGSLAPEGSVAKITGKEGEVFKGTAKVFDQEEAMIKALEEKKIQKGDIIVIRYEGPKGGPGMPEMLNPTSAIMGAGLGKDVALITDGRFSGGSHGFIVGHITPEAFDGGPIALIENGDQITIDAINNRIDLLVAEDILNLRRRNWVQPVQNIKGTLAKFVKLVKSASLGCVTD